jgi:hypothetical protein
MHILTLKGIAIKHAMSMLPCDVTRGHGNMTERSLLLPRHRTVVVLQGDVYYEDSASAYAPPL